MRAQALASARRLIVEGTDEVLTMRAVADAAGVTYPNLSHHFGSAAGLHAAIAEDLVRELLAGLQTVDVEMDNLEHDYRAVVVRVFDLFSQNGLGRVLGWLVRSGETSRLEPVNRMLADVHFQPRAPPFQDRRQTNIARRPDCRLRGLRGILGRAAAGRHIGRQCLEAAGLLRASTCCVALAIVAPAIIYANVNRILTYP